jgi:putative DNA primase/helicase
VLVVPLWRWQKTAEPGREVLAARLMPMRHSQLSDMVQHHAVIFQKYNAHSKVWKNIDPPSAVIDRLLNAGHWGFPDVVGIVNTPTMRPDGSLLTEPGYDPVTQLWYKPGRDVVLGPVPERPTKDDALAALRVLKELLKNFPFADDKDVSLSVALAGILTPVLRGQFSVAPLLLFQAPEPGTGKTYLCKTITTIATGREVSGSAAAENKEEMEKRLTADAVEAPPILHLNNVSFDLESALLSEMVSEGLVKIRPLGKTERIACDCTGMTVLINGNNIRVIGELVRRTVPAG